MAFFNWFNKKNNVPEEQLQETKSALGKTRENIFSKLSRIVAGKREIDAAFLDEIEEALLTSDVGVDTTIEIINALEAKAKETGFLNIEELNSWLAEVIANLMPEITAPVAPDFTLEGIPRPYVVLVVGVNGVGKTTTIGKMAYQYAQAGHKVILGAADTFRAAAVDQLNIWKDRAGVEIVSHGMNADPASVAFDAVKQGVEQNADVIIIDTAGRLHNKVGLMNELAKINRVIQKFKADAPNEIILVIDATTGQNAFEQAKEFTFATKVNALAVTKLDGTAKGGVVIGVSHSQNIPVKYIGIGEQAKDLKLFDKYSFIESIFQS